MPSFPKRKPVRSRKILDSARDEECTVRLPGVCLRTTDHTVFAHSNRGADGKGGAQKADDDRGAYACYACHAVYDRQVKRPLHLDLSDVEAAFDRGMEETRARLRSKGLLT